MKRRLLILVLFAILAAGCGLVETEPAVVEVTRIVDNPVEVTRVVTETQEVTRVVTEQVEVPVTPTPLPTAPVVLEDPDVTAPAVVEDPEEAAPAADPESTPEAPAAPAAEDEDDEVVVVVDDESIMPVAVLDTTIGDDDQPYQLVFTDWVTDEFHIISGGIPDEVPLEGIDVAGNGYEAPWPSLAAWLAEPGKLVVGEDFPEDQLQQLTGVWRSDSLNQYRLDDPMFTNVGCSEGSLVMIVAQYGVMEFENGTVIAWRVPDGSNMHWYVRCPVADGERGSDDSDIGNIRVSNYRPGYGYVQHFPGNPPGGFISADGALQALTISQTAESCGTEGCLSTYVGGYDISTKAMSVAGWNGQDMLPLESNWWDD